MNRYQDWLDQGRGNLSHAKKSLQMGDYAWACFAAQQAAEMAAKGLHMKLGQIAWGHSLLELLTALPEGYPNAHSAGPAHRYYNEKEAREARKGLEEGWGVARVALEEGLVLFERGSALEDLQLKAGRERPDTDG
ncbi:MAG: HEPN domain-containing protein [Candidatus Bipolaricaulia bacterium]